MDTVTAILAAAWAFANSALGIAILAGALLWILNRVYAARPAWAKYEGAIIEAIKWAEKTIPDDTANKAGVKLNAALNYVLMIHGKATEKPASTKDKDAIAEGIRIVQAELEAAGNLDKPAPTEPATTKAGK